MIYITSTLGGENWAVLSLKIHQNIHQNHTSNTSNTSKANTSNTSPPYRGDVWDGRDVLAGAA
jgi:hypothetical protein